MSSVSALSGGSTALQNFTLATTRRAAQVKTAASVGLQSQKVSGAASNDLGIGTTNRPSAVSAASAATDVIQAALQQLLGLTQQAANPATSDQARTSLQAAAQKVVATIDTTVRSATIGNANLIASSANSVRLSTPAQGGQVVAAVQALDSKGLGLTGLNLTTSSGVQNALSTVTQAISVASDTSSRISAVTQTRQRQDGQTLSNTNLAQAASVVSFNTYGSAGQQQLLLTTQLIPKGSVLSIES
jgi:flagellin